MPDTLPTSPRHVRAPSSLGPFALLALVGAVAVACTAAPPAEPSPSPGDSPVTTPPPTTASPTPSIATPAPSPATPAAPSPEAGTIEHPTGATDVVLRMEQGGGFVPMGWFDADAPGFTLYGDGTFILRPQEDPERSDAWTDGMPRFLHGRMTEEYVQSLLGYALTTGRLLDARDTYPQNECADCGSTIFTISAAGMDKTVTVDALEMTDASGPDAGDRRGFAQLAQTIADLEGRARGGELGEVVIYDPDFYRVTLIESFGEPAQEPAAWPWADVSTDDFEAQAEFSNPARLMSREDVARLLEVPSGGHMGVWVEEADGTQWQMAVRPLLPEELPAD
jgi:hypothetical protein